MRTYTYEFALFDWKLQQALHKCSTAAAGEERYTAGGGSFTKQFPLRETMQRLAGGAAGTVEERYGIADAFPELLPDEGKVCAAEDNAVELQRGWRSVVNGAVGGQDIPEVVSECVALLLPCFDKAHDFRRGKQAIVRILMIAAEKMVQSLPSDCCGSRHDENAWLRAVPYREGSRLYRRFHADEDHLRIFFSQVVRGSGGCGIAGDNDRLRAAFPQKAKRICLLYTSDAADD